MEDMDAEKNIALSRNIVMLNCCNKEWEPNCLLRHFNDDMAKAAAFVKCCLLEKENLKGQQYNDFMLQKVESTVIGISKRGYLKHNFVVGPPHDRIFGVCRECFRNCYEMSFHRFATSVKMIKAKEVVCLGNLGDRTAFTCRPSELVCAAKTLGVKLKEEQCRIGYLPNTPEAHDCYAWMKRYFSLVGDYEPNTDGEIHLEPSSYKEVWTEYMEVQMEEGRKYLSLSQFYRIWKDCFPHVRFREFKGVTGKCATCFDLSKARRTYRVGEDQELTGQLHHLHTLSVKNERQDYHDRIEDARNSNDKVSINSDGMQQPHSAIPYTGGLKQLDYCLQQHIQGLLVHGKHFIANRSFHNINNDSNLQIHCFLTALELLLKERNMTALDIIYFQVDGGAENVSKTVFAMMELIVAKGLARQVVMTRLPVGHTHTDIDARFGTIWTNTRRAILMSPQEYSEAICEIFKGNACKTSVTDIWVTPDYKQILMPCFDKKFKNYCKGSSTQHQWKFVRVPVCGNFPLGVKTTYRKYSREEFLDIKIKHGKRIEFEGDIVVSKDYPEAVPETENDPGRPEGMYLLFELPKLLDLKPAAFKAGSREDYDKCMRGIRKAGDTNVIKQWEEFEKEVPFSDDAEEYVRVHPEKLRVPLGDILFGDVKLKECAPSTRNADILSAFPKIIAQPSVSWSERGVNHKQPKPKKASATRHNNVMSSQVYCQPINDDDSFPNNDKGLMFVHDNLRVYDDDFYRLEPGYWINDTIIDVATDIGCLAKPSENVFTLSALVYKFSKFEDGDFAKTKRIFKDKNVIVLPCNMNNLHWLLYVAFINLEENKCYLICLDSMKAMKLNYPALSLKRIKNAFTSKYRIENSTSTALDIEVIDLKDVPQQPNGYDCGMYTILFHKAVLNYVENYVWEVNDNYNKKSNIQKFFRETILDTVNQEKVVGMRGWLQVEFLRIQQEYQNRDNDQINNVNLKSSSIGDNLNKRMSATGKKKEMTKANVKLPVKPQTKKRQRKPDDYESSSESDDACKKADPCKNIQRMTRSDKYPKRQKAMIAEQNIKEMLHETVDYHKEPWRLNDSKVVRNFKDGVSYGKVTNYNPRNKKFTVHYDSDSEEDEFTITEVMEMLCE